MKTLSPTPLAAAALALAALLAGPAAQAATKTFNCNNTNYWNNANCWVGGVGPSQNDDATVAGNGGIGTMVVHDSFLHAVKSLNVSSPGQGTVQLKLTGGTLRSPSTTIGSNASFLIEGGTFDAVTRVGGNFVNQGTFTYNGGALLNLALLNQGTLNVNAGQALYLLNQPAWFNASGGTINVGANAGISGTVYNLPGGTVTGSGGIGALQNNGGKLQVYAGNTMQFDRVQNSGQIVLAAGVRDAVIEVFPSDYLSNVGLSNVGGGVISGSGTIIANVTNSIGGTVRVDNGGQLDLRGFYRASSGSTTQVDGTLRLNGGGVDLGDGAAFTGAGWTNIGKPDASTVLNVGGFGSGTATVQGNLRLNNATLVAKLGGTQRGKQYDALTVGGTLALGGAATLWLSSLDSFIAQAGQSFDILSFGALTGTFSSIDASNLLLAPGTVLDTSRLYTTGTLSVVAVPEPATWLMLGLGLLGVGTRRRVAAARAW